MIESVLGAIDDCPVREDGSEAAPAGLDHGRFAADIEETVVLAGEARRRQVLGRRRTADRDRQLNTVFRLHGPPGGTDFGAKRFAIHGVIDDLSGRLSAPRKLLHIAYIETVQKFAKLRPGVSLRQAVAIGRGRDGKTRRSFDAGAPQRR